MKTFLSALFFVTIMIGTARPAADVYEGFDYPAGQSLNGKGGGKGFTGVWQPGGFNAASTSKSMVANGSLAFNKLQSWGQSVSSKVIPTISGMTRQLATPVGTPGTTVYFSYLLQPEGTLNKGALSGFFGLVLATSGDSEILFGKAGSNLHYAIESRGGKGRRVSETDIVSGQTTLLVVKAEFGQDLDQFTLFVNPTPGAPEPAAGTVKNDVKVGMITALTLYGAGEFRADELRVGKSFGDVTPSSQPPQTK